MVDMMIAAFRQALHAFKQTYNDEWIVERHGNRIPAEVRADQLAATPIAARESHRCLKTVARYMSVHTDLKVRQGKVRDARAAILRRSQPRVFQGCPCPIGVDGEDRTAEAGIG